MHLLFVCTGNTCRSPMAEALARARTAERNLDWVVSSAGLYAVPGSPMTEPAKQALLRRAVPLGKHQSRTVAADIVKGANLILAMTSSQADDLRSRFPNASYKIHELGEFLDDPGRDSKRQCDIVDPFGGSDEQYEWCAKTLENAVDRLIDRLVDGTVPTEVE